MIGVITVDHGSPVPPFEQIRLAVARQIQDGQLPVGAQLPTVRALAADLALAPNTVARAYRELEAAGLVSTGGRRGTVVTAQGDAVRSEAAQAATEFAATMSRLGIPLREALNVAKAALERTGLEPTVGQ